MPFWLKTISCAILKNCDHDAIACKVGCSCQACDAGLESQNGGQWGCSLDNWLSVVRWTWTRSTSGQSACVCRQRWERRRSCLWRRGLACSPSGSWWLFSAVKPSNSCSGASSCGRAWLRATKACSAGTLRLCVLRWRPRDAGFRHVDRPLQPAVLSAHCWMPSAQMFSPCLCLWGYIANNGGNDFSDGVSDSNGAL